jgi:hypothetical protein
VHELLVLVLAVILTAYLGVRYWRALLWSASQHRLSEATRELGDWIDGPQGEKSLHMVCALLRVCPRLERGSDRKVMAVRAYDAILAVAEKVSGGRGRGNLWIAAERKAHPDQIRTLGPAGRAQVINYRERIAWHAPSSGGALWDR